MDLLIGIIKFVFAFATVFLAALPFILEYRSYLKDKANKIANRRFRIMIFTMLYVIALTVICSIIHDVIAAISSINAVAWLAAKLALPARAAFFSEVVAALLINFAVGVLFRLLLKLVRIGIGKRSLTEGEKYNKAFSFAQKAERAVIRCFKNDVWVSAANIIKILSIVLSAVYAALFLIFQCIAFIDASWIPFDFLLQIFNAGAKYPAIALLLLWESFFFLAGINDDIDKCPDTEGRVANDPKKDDVDIDAIDKAVREKFWAFYACNVDVRRMAGEHSDEERR